MKKIMAAAAILCLAASCFAVTPSQQKMEREALVGDDQSAGLSGEEAPLVTLAGEIVSIKRSLNKITVKDQNTSTEKEFTVKSEDIKSVKLGDTVEVKYKPGSGVADSITAAKPSQPSPAY
ncbi:MAG: hypothetical protein WC317_06445 [Candidatus Omnitrophota bacterium]|jgi:hypothetical protein